MVLALHLFNLSIDAPDARPDSVPEDLAVNDIESIAEFLTEVVFGCENAFAEQDERDSEKGGSLDFRKCYLFSNHSVALTDDRLPFVEISHVLVDGCQQFFSIARDVTSPPPES